MLRMCESQAADLEVALFGSGPEELPHAGDEVHGQRHKKGDAKWIDDDDENLNVDVASKRRLRKLRKTVEEGDVSGKDFEGRLREQHVKLYSNSGWAEKLIEAKEKGVVEADSTLLRATGFLASSKKLPAGILEITKLRDANQSHPSQSVVNSVEFHPNGQLLMTAGLDRRARFFSVDGVKNPHIQTVLFEDMPVHQSCFIEHGSKVVFSGRRSFFYFLDLESSRLEKVGKLFGQKEKSYESFVASNSSDTMALLGQDGNIPLLSLRSRQKIGSLKMNGAVRSGAFGSDGISLYSCGSDGIVYVWDIRMQRCIKQFVDEGNLGGTSMAVSPSGHIIASGSKNGIVNLYKGEDIANSTAMGAAMVLPVKSLPHLTTTVDTLSFSGDGQILAMSSRMKKESLRLIHMPSMTAFSNWPTSKSPLHYIHSLAFSPTGSYLAVGNAKGRILLYRLHHFPC